MASYQDWPGRANAPAALPARACARASGLLGAPSAVWGNTAESFGLGRMGPHFNKESVRMKSIMSGRVWPLVLACALALVTAVQAHSAGYVGSAACGECHPDQYETFSRHSKKATSRKSVEIMAADLTDEELRECYACHTTGYGKGGFVSYEATPHLADVGCETCHGPGAAHAREGDPARIMLEPRLSDCEVCHNSERVADFNYKPLLYSGAH